MCVCVRKKRKREEERESWKQDRGVSRDGEDTFSLATDSTRKVSTQMKYSVYRKPLKAAWQAGMD